MPAAHTSPKAKTLPEKFRVEINGCRPFALTRRDMGLLSRSPKLVQRLVWSMRHGPSEDQWLKAFREGAPGRELLVTTDSFERAIERLAAGEQPPLLPSELRRSRADESIEAGQRR